MSQLIDKSCYVSFAAMTLLAMPISAATPTVNEIEKLLASDAAGGDAFGSSVAVDGETAVIGARESEGNRGAAYVFVRSGGAWTEQQKLTASDGATDDNFGAAVAVSGDTAMVGANEDDDLAGSVYVFVRSGGVWIEQQKLTASDAAANRHFGTSISLDTDTAVIGEAGDSEIPSAAYVFVRGGGNWSEQQKLTGSDAAAGDLFGRDVAVDGDTAVVGAQLHDDSGAAYVFVRSAGVWTEQQKLTASDAAEGDLFGFSVDVEGDAAAVGAAFDDDAGLASGSAYVFSRSAGAWGQQQKLAPSDGVAFDTFGSAVALAGHTVVISARGSTSRVGSAYAFTQSGGTWTETLKLLASDGSVFDEFGFEGNGSNLAISGVTVVAGAMLHDLTDPARVDAGAAYVFSLETDDEGPLVSDVLASPNPVAISAPITISATIDDTDTGGSDIASAAYRVDGGGLVAMAASDGDFDSPTEDVSAGIAGGLPVGIHDICVSGTDAAANTGPAECTLLAVYDPSGGFVTGGGWIESPAGAYVADASLTGRANFGFVSSYRKGATVPEGNAQFAFQAGDLDFHSGSFEWLVVAGGKAQLKGVGTINGQGNYGFLLFATDAESTATVGDLDSFRIQLWDRNNGDAVVYDNYAELLLGGGSIIAHAGAKK